MNSEIDLDKLVNNLKYSSNAFKNCYLKTIPLKMKCVLPNKICDSQLAKSKRLQMNLEPFILKMSKLRENLQNLNHSSRK